MPFGTVFCAISVWLDASFNFGDDFCSTGLLGVDVRGAKNTAIYMVWGQNAVAQHVFEIVLEGPTPHCILHFLKYPVFDEIVKRIVFFEGCNVEMCKCSRK